MVVSNSTPLHESHLQTTNKRKTLKQLFRFLQVLNISLYFFLLPFLFQTISVSVSVLTLSCIAQDRWYAICHPLMFKSTAKRARKSIVVIWVVSCVIMIPQAIVMECSSLLPELTNKTSLFTVCDEHWGGKSLQIPLKHTTEKLLLICHQICRLGRNNN